LVHLVACLWYGYANFIGYPFNSWVVANPTKGNIIINTEESGPYKYLVSVYWAFQAVTTVGYGDHTWGNGLQHEYVIAFCWMFVGSFIYTLAIGNVSAMIASSDSKAAILSHQMSVLLSLAQRIDLSNDSLERIQRYLENRSGDNDSIEDQENLMKHLPPALKNEIEQLTQNSITRNIYFFQSQSSHFNRAIMQYLVLKKVYKNDSIFSQGDPAEDIFFVQQGSFTILVDISDHIDCDKIGINPMIESFNVPFNSYSTGSFFGDEDTLSSKKKNDDEGDNKRIRNSTASALKDSDILVIRIGQLKSLFTQFTSVEQNMIKVADEKVKYHKRLIEQVI
jgi:CRP-like cAMP-binding protein